MRDIKFRAWSKATSTMVDLKKITPLALSEGTGDGIFVPFKEGIVIMQYTGLKDKNGVEIYEGDIIDYGFYGTKEVAFLNGCFGVLTKGNNGSSFGTYQICDGFVIGNKFENPDLLSL